MEVEADAPGNGDDVTRVDVRGESIALPAAELDAVLPGTKISRYTILEIIGAGGVGIVYSAYDPDLDRKVAIKQLRRSKLLGQTEAVNNRRARLVREAQALARLSHPNVVPVYEVATFDGQIYVVMEFVDGITLGQWLAAEPRTWSEIVALFVQAGRGLAAAHAADIVHRDFKPENLLVGHDGRVRVLDFGLAAPLRDSEHDPEPEPSHSGSGSAELIDEHSWSDSFHSSNSNERAPMTREGQVMGTPAYMAPEQARGGHVDARSDQFSFCVALYEALYGTRPFRGAYDNLRRFRDLSRASRLPGNRPAEMPQEIERVLIRGLSLAPDRRFANMDELLTALGSVARGWRRLLWVPIGTLVLALATVVGFYERREVASTASCDDGHSMLAGVWDEAIAAELEAAAERTGQPYAGETWATAERSLDAWVTEWSRARVNACEGARNGKRRSDLLARRMGCLDLQLVRVEAMVAGLRRQAGTPDSLLERLSGLSLPSLDGCASASILARDDLQPEDETHALEAAIIREQLATIEGLITIGDHERALARAEAALASAAQLGFEPVIAESQLQLGLALHSGGSEHERAEAALREAVWAAERSDDELVVVRAAAALAEIAGSDSAKLDVAEIWADHARAAFVRHGSDLGVELELRQRLGALAMVASDYDGALVEFERALELAAESGGEQSPDYVRTLIEIGDAQRELGHFEQSKQALTRAKRLAAQVFGSKHPMIGQIFDALANVESVSGEFVAALELHRAALALNEEIYGPEHRAVAKNLNNLAIIYDETGRYNESAETLLRAREILVKQLGPDHPEVAFVDVNLGSALQNLGRYEEAKQRNELALQNLERSLGPAHMAVGVTLQNLAVVLTQLGDLDGALAASERAQPILIGVFGHEHHSLAELELSRARILRELGRLDEAIAAATRALTMLEKIFGARHHELVAALVSLTQTELRLGDHAGAREHAEQAVQLASDDNTPIERAEARMRLAQALRGDPAATEADEQRARALALEALAIMRSAEGQGELRAELDAWLAEQGLATVAG